MKVKITSDSTCDLSAELIKKYDIEIVPLSVLLGERAFRDGTEMKTDDIYTYVNETGELPKTNAVSIGDYSDVFERWVGEGYSIVHFCISSDFSSTYQNACIAAGDYDHVCIVDSRNLSTGQGLLVLHGAEMAAQGKEAEEVYAECTALTEKVDASFVIDSLDYLYKGGRCSALSAFGANLLKLKPCIIVKDGKMTPDRKYRGMFDKIILDYVRDQLGSCAEVDLKRIFLTHTRCSEDTIRAVRQILEEKGFQEVLETTAGATITTHCGPNTLGVLFMRK